MSQKHFVDQPLHPRPQIARESWIDLNGTWDFCFDDGDCGIDEGWWGGVTGPFDREILVPFPPESVASGVQEDGHPRLWYRRVLLVERPSRDQRLILHFEAVDYRADVWMNGVKVASHEGGQVGFAADVTHALSVSGANTIVVRAFDDVTSLEQPRGKQDWEPVPHVIWYRRTSGIWRQVWAEIVDVVHLESLNWVAGAQPGSLSLDAVVAGVTPQTNATLDLEFTLDGVRLAASSHSVSESGQVRAMVEIRDTRFDSEPHRLLWSPESPVLIEATARIRVSGAGVGADGAEGGVDAASFVDRVSSYVGLRTVSTDDRYFLLNSRPYFMKLVLEQAFWPESHLAAPSDDSLRLEVELIKSLGFNGIRMHQTVADARFLYWCDRLGLLVWADTAAAYRFSSVSIERTTREWMEIVRRDSSHPSVVAWVAFNESWGVPDLEVDEAQRDAVRALFHLLKTLDPTRLVIGNDGWEFVCGDVLGVHDYTQDAARLTERYGSAAAVASTVASGRPGGRRLAIDTATSGSLPVVLSEFGGVTFSRGNDVWEGYGAVHTDDHFTDNLAALIGAANTAEGLAGYCYTQLTDTLQEANGLVTEARVPKAATEVIRAIIEG